MSMDMNMNTDMDMEMDIDVIQKMFGESRQCRGLSIQYVLVDQWSLPSMRSLLHVPGNFSETYKTGYILYSWKDWGYYYFGVVEYKYIITTIQQSE
jgi:hypothetical protein